MAIEASDLVSFHVGRAPSPAQREAYVAKVVAAAIRDRAALQKLTGPGVIPTKSEQLLRLTLQLEIPAQPVEETPMDWSGHVAEFRRAKWLGREDSNLR